MGLFDRTKKTEEKKVSQGKVAPVKTGQKKVQAVKEEKQDSMKDLYSGTTASSTKDNADKTVKVKKFGNAYQVLVKPVITEKAAHFGTENKYVFAVAVDANKIEVAKAINEVYGIKPVDINIINVRGKKVRYGKKYGQRKGWKKAIVTLPAGKTINIYEGV